MNLVGRDDHGEDAAVNDELHVVSHSVREYVGVNNFLQNQKYTSTKELGPIEVLDYLIWIIYNTNFACKYHCLAVSLLQTMQTIHKSVKTMKCRSQDDKIRSLNKSTRIQASSTCRKKRPTWKKQKQAGTCIGCEGTVY